MQRARERDARTTAFSLAMATPHGEKPTEKEWMAGPWASEIRTLQTYALQEPDAGDLTIPTEILDIVRPFTGGAAHPSSVGELLKQLGVWAPHQYIPLIRAGLTNQFNPQIMVWVPRTTRQSRFSLFHRESSL